MMTFPALGLVLPGRGTLAVRGRGRGTLRTYPSAFPSSVRPSCATTGPGCRYRPSGGAHATPVGRYDPAAGAVVPDLTGLMDQAADETEPSPSGETPRGLRRKRDMPAAKPGAVVVRVSRIVREVTAVAADADVAAPGLLLSGRQKLVELKTAAADQADAVRKDAEAALAEVKKAVE